MASRLDRIPGKKQRVMTARPLSSPEPSTRSCPRSILFPQPLSPAQPSCRRAPFAWGGGGEAEFRTRRQKTVLGPRRSTRGHKKGPGGARAELFPCSNSCNSPLNAADPRVGRLSSRKPVKSMPKIYEPPCGSVNYQSFRATSRKLSPTCIRLCVL